MKLSEFSMILKLKTKKPRSQSIKVHSKVTSRHYSFSEKSKSIKFLNRLINLKKFRCNTTGSKHKIQRKYAKQAWLVNKLGTVGELRRGDSMSVKNRSSPYTCSTTVNRASSKRWIPFFRVELEPPRLIKSESIFHPAWTYELQLPLSQPAFSWLGEMSAALNTYRKEKEKNAHASELFNLCYIKNWVCVCIRPRVV